MEEEFNPTTPVPGADATNVPAAESEVNDSQTVSLKDIVKQATGREYSSDEDAFKGISETYKFVTKKMEPTPQVTPEAPQADPALVSKVEQLASELKETKF